MIYNRQLNKHFATKEEMFTALREAAKDIIYDKCNKVYKSIDKAQSVTAHPLDPLKLGAMVKDISVDSDYYYIAVNTTLILDSHEDLHINGIWDESLEDTKGNVYLVSNHSLDPLSTLACKEDIEVFTAILPFSALGKPYAGETQALIYKIRKDAIMEPKISKWLDKGKAIQASVRMWYDEILFCMDSEAENDKEAKANFVKYYPMIANINDVKWDVYCFWAVLKARNDMESSLCLYGSDPVTGQVAEADVSTKEEDDDEGDDDDDFQEEEDKTRQFLLSIS